MQNEKCKIQKLRLKVFGNRIEYQLPNAGPVKVGVYNIAGQRVRTLIDEDKKMGGYEAVWDGKDNGNRRVTSGVYLVRLVSNDQTAAAKMVVVR